MRWDYFVRHYRNDQQLRRNPKFLETYAGKQVDGMLSGIGPREELEAHGIDVRVDLQGVERNLQDRYEISVVNRMNFDEWHIFKDVHFDAGEISNGKANGTAIISPGTSASSEIAHAVNIFAWQGKHLTPLTEP